MLHEDGCNSAIASTTEYFRGAAAMEKTDQERRTFTNGKCSIHVYTISYTCTQNATHQMSTSRNLQKRAKKGRHEREKAFMEELRGAGHAVGEYIGGGRADMGLEDDEGHGRAVYRENPG